MAEIVDNKLKDEENKDTVKIQINKEMSKNLDIINEKMQGSVDLILRQFELGEKRDRKLAVSYIDGMVNRDLIDQRIMQPLMFFGRNIPPKIESVEGLYAFIKNNSITTADLKEIYFIEDALEDILIGETVLFVDGEDKAFMISTRGWPNRGIQPPNIESVIRGPSDAFTETIRMNTALIRRRIRDSRLKINQLRVGRRSLTDIAVVYIDDIVNKNVLKEVKERLSKIDIDAVIESGYIEQLIEDNSNTVFPQIQNTQRPDEAVAAILEGRVVIIVDNTPFVLIVPGTLNSLFQVAEDYYDRWPVVSLIRMLRLLAFCVAIGLPGLYIAVISYHPDFIPVSFLLSIASTRANVPFPAFLEAIFMELTIETLREAGERLPSPIGQVMGIVGGLVIGQAAVAANIVSPIMVIIVAFTAISSFVIPNYNLTIGIRVVKFLLIFAAAVLGFYGFVLGVFVLLIHLVSLKSFGVPYLTPFVALEKGDLKDTVIRAPLKAMQKRSSLVYANRRKIQYTNTGDDDDKR